MGAAMSLPCSVQLPSAGSQTRCGEIQAITLADPRAVSRNGAAHRNVRRGPRQRIARLSFVSSRSLASESTKRGTFSWADADFQKQVLRVRITKNGKTRWIPFNQSLRDLLEKLRVARPDESPETPIMPVFECQKSIDRAAKLVGVGRITHHDLRQLFASRCIEAGVDIPTVSRWLGHQDGGALCMKTYGHLRDEPSANEAKKVSF
jgi:hypothetical protein